MDLEMIKAIKTLSRAGQPLGFLPLLDRENLLLLVAKANEALLAKLGVEIKVLEKPWHLASFVEDLVNNEVLDKETAKNYNIYSRYTPYNFTRDPLYTPPFKELSPDVINDVKQHVLYYAGGLLNAKGELLSSDYSSWICQSKGKEALTLTKDTRLVLAIYYVHHDAWAEGGPHCEWYANLIAIKEKSQAQKNRENKIYNAKEEKERAKLAELLKKYPDAKAK